MHDLLGRICRKCCWRAALSSSGSTASTTIQSKHEVRASGTPEAASQCQVRAGDVADLHGRGGSVCRWKAQLSHQPRGLARYALLTEKPLCPNPGNCRRAAVKTASNTLCTPDLAAFMAPTPACRFFGMPQGRTASAARRHQ